MSKPFTWKVLYLDDGHPQAISKNHVRALQEAGFSVLALGSKDELKNNASELHEYDLALCDMQWIEFASSAEFSCIPNLKRDGHKEFVAKWIDAVRSWVSRVNTPAVSEGDWPKSAISKSEVGVWLAAMLKHLNPSMQTILFSADPSIRSEGPLAALSCFPDPVFGVVRKVEVLRPESLAPSLRKAQMFWLRERSDIYAWFLARVLVPILLKREPRTQAMPGIHGEEELTFDAERFFPTHVVRENVAQNEKLNLNELLLFLLPNEEVQIWEKVAMQNLRHRIRSFSRAWSSDPTLDEARKSLAALAEESLDCGLSGQRIHGFFHIDSESNTLDPDHIKKVFERAAEACGTVADNGIPNLKNVLDIFCGQLIFVPPRKPDSSQKHSQRSLPFDCDQLKRALQTLDDNRARFNGAGREVTASWERKGELSITWKDTSLGFKDFDEFAQQVITSIDKKRENRGLPLAILFGLRSKAKSIEVSLQPDIDEWTLIYPPENQRAEDADSVVEIAPGKNKGLGFRWTFPWLPESSDKA